MSEGAVSRAGLCGFISVAASEGPDDILAAMARRLAPCAADGDAAGETDGGAGLEVYGGFEEGSLEKREERLAAIRGLPRWRDEELAVLAERSGHAEALLEADRRYPDGAFLRHLEGSFALAVLAPGQGRALIAVDRFGIEPLRWARTSAGGFAFGSTNQSVAACPGVDAAISAQALYDYLFFFVIPGPQTIYRGVTKVAPAQCVRFEGGAVHAEYYWSMPYAAADGAEEGGHGHAGAELIGELDRAVRESLEGLDPATTGVFLSGGLDSSTMAGLVARAHGGAHTFTIGFAESKFDETPYARITAEHFGTEHTEYFVTAKDAAEVLPRLATSFDEPFGNSSAIPAYLCARIAREKGVRVLIAGDGGDELFAGNERYASMRRFEVYGRIPAPLRRWLLDPVLALPWWGRVPVLGKAQRLMQRYNMPLARRVYTYAAISGLAPDAFLAREFLASIDGGAPERIIRRAIARHASDDDTQAMMGLDMTLTLADNDIVKVNGACGLAGTGVRYPMLGDRLGTFAAGIPSDTLMPGGELRGFYKKAMVGFLHQETLVKEKHGFGAPLDIWGRSDPGVRTLFLDSLSDFRKRDILNDRFANRLESSLDPDSNDPIVSSAYDIMVLEQWLASHG